MLNSPCRVQADHGGAPGPVGLRAVDQGGARGSILDGFIVIFAMSVLAVIASLFMPASLKKAKEEGPPVSVTARA